jgi:hypothetical protein
MSPVQARAISRSAVPAVNHAARLELLEYYLVHHEDLVRCAQASIDWLVRHSGVKRALCLAVDGEANSLVGIAGVGVPSDDLERYSWQLFDGRDPLIAALTSRKATVLRGPKGNGAVSRPQPSRPFGGALATAIPLRGSRDTGDGAVGLLLLRGSVEITADIAWLATVLGQKIEQIRGRGGLADEVRQLRRERALFFTIINAVTDPILLTDTEGRLIVRRRGQRRAAPRRRVEQHAVLGRALSHGG